MSLESIYHDCLLRRSGESARKDDTRSTSLYIANQNPFPFLRLPPELRHLIYGYLFIAPYQHLRVSKIAQMTPDYDFGDPETYYSRRCSIPERLFDPSILKVCKLIRAEAQKVLLMINNVHFCLLPITSETGTISRLTNTAYTSKVVQATHRFLRRISIAHHDPKDSPHSSPQMTELGDVTLALFIKVLADKCPNLRNLSIFFCAGRYFKFKTEDASTEPFAPLTSQSLKRLIFSAERLSPKIPFIGTESQRVTAFIESIAPWSHWRAGCLEGYIYNYEPFGHSFRRGSVANPGRFYNFNGRLWVRKGAEAVYEPMVEHQMQLKWHEIGRIPTESELKGCVLQPYQLPSVCNFSSFEYQRFDG